MLVQFVLHYTDNQFSDLLCLRHFLYCKPICIDMH